MGRSLVRTSTVSIRVVRVALAVGALLAAAWYSTLSANHALGALAGAMLGLLLGRWPDAGARRVVAACGIGGLAIAFAWRISVGCAYGLAWSAMMVLARRSDRPSDALTPGIPRGARWALGIPVTLGLIVLFTGDPGWEVRKTLELNEPASFECMVEALASDPALSLASAQQTGSEVSFQELRTGHQGGMSYGFVGASNQVVVYLGEVGEAPDARQRLELEQRRDEIASRVIDRCRLGVRSARSACHPSGLFANFCE